jgi:hypothetical protein
MSHWTKVKLKVTDEATLVAALKRMGCPEVQTGTRTITQYGQSDTANVWVDGAIGFKLETDGTYSMVGDFYHSRGNFRKYYGRNQEFEKDLNVAYAVEDTKVKLDELGFEITENAEAVVGEDGMIRMVASSFYA